MKIKLPEGLGNNFCDLIQPVGICYVEGMDRFELSLETETLTVFFPFCHSLFKYKMKPDSSTSADILDTYNVLSIPGGFRLSLQSQSQADKGVLFSFSKGVIKEALELYDIPSDDFFSIFSQTLILSRKNWVNEIVHRYHYERQHKGRGNINACNFLETELIKELYTLYIDKGNITKDRFDLGDYNFKMYSAPVQKAILYMDDQIYNVLSIEKICKHIGVGVTTFRRTFKNEVGVPPISFFRKRKLEQAYYLLRTGRYTVSEVAFLLSFEEVSSFTSAFKKSFGSGPKNFIP